MKAIVVACAFALSATTAAAGVLPTDDFHHRVRIEGRGPRTVILESGIGDTLDIWNAIQPRIAAHCARTLAYTRAGYVGSEPASGPRDAATIVAELRAELQRRGIAPPYVLVGHSIGGLYMQYFARNYPGEVAGLVLVDSTHWDQHLGLTPGANAPYSQQREVTLFMPWIMRREFTDSKDAGEQVHESPPAEDLPTIVLSSTNPPMQSETPAARVLAARLQDEIAADFPAARHVRVDGSGHYIQRDRPDVVINAVRELAGCSALQARR